MTDHDSDIAVATRKTIKIEKPRRFKVLLHNDHYTTMEFVVEILMTIFSRSEAESVEIMFKVHREGIGLAGVYTKEIAETKVNRVQNEAREAGYPLKCSMEPE